MVVLFAAVVMALAPVSGEIVATVQQHNFSQSDSWNAVKSICIVNETNNFQFNDK